MMNVGVGAAVSWEEWWDLEMGKYKVGRLEK
jgi:hypothetical protein